jgi:hypothetical protein
MIFSPNASEIPKLFVEVFEKTVDLEFQNYLANEGRGFIAVVVSDENPGGLLVARCGLDERSATTLFMDVMEMRLPNGLGAYLTPSLFPNGPLEHDVLLIQQRWLNLDTNGRIAIAYHEVCHCFCESKLFHSISDSSVAYHGGKHYRKFTSYHDNDDFGHHPQWFALLVQNAQIMQSKYPGLFASAHAVIESALSGDIRLSEGEILPEWKAVAK